MAPSSQKYRTISFYLTGGNQPQAMSTLLVRPEDLSRSEPSRLQVQQTLGGAWADAFDRGVSTITLSGTQGWRGSPALSGEDAFADLRQTAFESWHDRRAAALTAGIDPATVKLYFVDDLDDINLTVAPQEFRLQRSKSYPLLMKYHLTLLVLSDAGAPPEVTDPITSAFSDASRWLASVTGLLNVITLLANIVNDVIAAVSAVVNAVVSTILGVISGLVGLVQDVINAAVGVAQTAMGIFDAVTSPLLTVASAVCQAASNVFAVYAAVTGLTAYAQAGLMQLSSLCRDAFCLLSNGFNTVSTYPSYDGLFGASNCSATGGGRPVSAYMLDGANPFYDMYDIGAGAVAVSAAAATALTTLTGDPLLLAASGVVSVGAATMDLVSGIATSVGDAVADAVS